MTELKQPGFARVLDFPRVYSWFANCIGGDARSAYTREYVRPVPGQRIVDIGCGPADIVSELPDGVEYVGIDMSPEYIEAARARFGDRATF
ncbi:MAG TPA: class I SAM-dependent methyltransferase, partial [Burkholderiales bacterium]|nr:class I SAM-dependent methyltransferase [Burkholderiales bacterium]